MDYDVLTLELVKLIVNNKDEVTLRQEINDDSGIKINIIVNDEDKDILTSKNGKNINAIRTLVQACGYLNDNNDIRIDVC